MYEKCGKILIVANIVLFLLVVSHYQKQIPQEEYKSESESTLITVEQVEVKLAESISMPRMVNENVLAKQKAYELSNADYEALLRIVQAEAGGEDENGKLLVANVVLNRVNSPKFPGNVRDVVFQSVDGTTQFSPVRDGRYFQVSISDETIQAVDRAIYGEDISEGALYFVSRKSADPVKMKWFERKLTFVFEHGGHEFYK